ncbi:MAG: iron-sulfur cluster insertion protein ErpA [Hyphomicrobiaceae bacterium]|nr:iron-sulfur cluster insertion protein ErpA [Hyphomicrobiaceae bacterium]
MTSAHTQEAPSLPVSLSPSAAMRINEITGDEPLNKLLRISVEGGGCSGFQYKFDLVAETEPDDLVLERDGAKVLIDPVSLGFLAGSEIDFVDDLMGAAFKITNPNATASCGCGTSFSI